MGGAVVWNDVVIVGSIDGRVFALTTDSGNVTWTAPVVTAAGDSVGDERNLALAGNHLMATSLTGIIVGLNPATGAEHWRNTAISASPLGLPSADPSYGYLFWGWQFVCYDLSTGSIRWEKPPSVSDPQTPFRGLAVPASEKVFLAGKDGSYGLRR